MRFPLVSWLSLVLCYCRYLSFQILVVSGFCLENQQSLLLQLKNELTIDHAYSKKLVFWNQSSDCCHWIGVICDKEGQVKGLDLSQACISGGLDNSSSLFNLQSLQILNLALNNFNCVIPSALIKLKNLNYLNLSTAGFVGEIPIEISHLTRLVTLDISTPDSYLISMDEDIRLHIPNLQKLVQKLTKLRQLYLDRVSVSAKGEEWCKALLTLPHLQELSMKSCDLSGPIDSSLARLKHLSVIRLDYNNFSSPVPEFFADFTNLTILHLSYCWLSGIFPQKIFQLVPLISIDISFNIGLLGSFPGFPPNGSLQTLVIRNTSFCGALPDSISNLSQLSILDLSTCQFQGTLPNSISQLSELTYLDLSFNNFTGPIPSPAYLQNLDRIDLSLNSLNGSIPSSLFELPLLQNVDLSFNNFEGPVPESIFQLRKLCTLKLSSNKFNGSMLLNKFLALRNLTVLELSYNNLLISVNDTDAHISSFPDMTRLQLASCKMRTIPSFLRHQSTLMYLDLSDNQIEGKIPNWIWKLDYLAVLNISNNFLTDLEGPLQNLSSNLLILDLHSNQLQGPIPVSLISANAIYLDYSSNNFNSVIPSDIGDKHPEIISLSFSSNRIHGSIPESICNLKDLEALDLSNNFLTGTIPKCLVAMNGTLSVLNLMRNKLSGSIDTFPGPCSLRILQLNGNLLQGKLPKYLATCNMLEVLDIGNNQIDDEFPCWLESIPTLRVLILRSNQLNGSFQCPVTNASWSQLQIIDLASNSITGTIPSAFFKSWNTMMADKNDEKLTNLQFLIPNLGQNYYQQRITVTSKGLQLELVKIPTAYTSVDLSCNKLKGPIPEDIGQLQALHNLNLSHNALWGHIPSSSGNMKQLESLDLSSNSLSGEIPIQLASLSFLSVLNLSFNELVGRIPTGSQLQLFEAASYKGNKGLCGPPLIQNCSYDRVPPPSRISHSDASSTNWKIISAELGFTFGIGMVILPIIFWKRWRLMFSEFLDRILYDIFPQLDFVQEKHGGQSYRTLRWKPY
ncbi:hypothetical protein L6164_002352 [Bauhinia variegata]|uniref:Uncharacterized protein n=1 Tax=Bauhinia variegata TaxID=167791 RepID=A0ACB9PX61_BAUVA|nr:hypothetical protein L6164_002352 [Bauhinia variegata]